MFTCFLSFHQIVIPFFSLFIKDIYFLNEGCVNRLPNGRINFEVCLFLSFLHGYHTKIFQQCDNSFTAFSDFTSKVKYGYMINCIQLLQKFWELAKRVSEFLSWRQVTCPFERDRKLLQYLISVPVFNEDGEFSLLFFLIFSKLHTPIQ